MHTATIILHISMLIASGSFDAYSTNRLASRCVTVKNCRFTEWNPLMRPFAGHPTAYAAIPVGDLAVYGLLVLRHKPRAARAFAISETVSHIGLSLNNLRQNPKSPAIPAALNSAAFFASAASGTTLGPLPGGH